MKDEQAVREVIHDYFLSTYRGEGNKLRNLFDSDAQISGIINGELLRWSLKDFSDRVSARPSAAEKNEVYQKEIISIDVAGYAAMVKSRVVVAGVIFTDYISLLKVNNQWVIKNKIFSA